MKLPGKASRGSTTGRPIMVLLDVLGQRWTLRVLWELKGKPATFRALRSRCDEISPTVLNKRLKELKELSLIDHSDSGYGLSAFGEELVRKFGPLEVWANKWAESISDEGQ